MRSAVKFVIGGSVCAAFGVIMKLGLFESILEFVIKDQTALRSRNEIHDIYLKIPFPLDFNIYMFNVSNPEEVINNGSKPLLNETGPYCYDEFVEKVNVVEDEDEDTLIYTGYNVYQFNKSRSGRLSDTDYVTILHPLIIGMVNQVTRDSPALLSIVNKAIMEIFQSTASVYLTARVKDILFDGVRIDCNVMEFPGKAVCSQLKQIPGLKVRGDDPNVYYFSLLGSRNASAMGRVKVERGIANSKNLGRVLQFNNENNLNLWSTPECNQFKGTDGWIFPPLMEENKNIESFSTDLCRNIETKFVENVQYKGLDLRKFDADLGDMEHNVEDKCYCPTPETCLKKGIFDLSKCMGVPIYVSLPHFLNADPMYLDLVDGLNPVCEDHSIRILMEPLTGTPIEARKRIQFNLPIGPNPKITIMHNLPEVLHPIFWLEEGLDLDGPLLSKIKTIFMLVKLVNIAFWLAMLLGLVIVGFGIYLHFHYNKKTVTLARVHSPKTDSSVGNLVSDSDINLKNKRGGYVNHVMTGHEFDKY